MIKSRISSQRGFTLIEVLIALGLLATALVALNSYQSYAIGSAAESEKLTIATTLARRKMAETELHFRNLDFSEIKDEEHGTFEDYPGFSWSLVTEEFELPIPTPPATEGQIGEDLTTEVFTKKLSEILSEYVLKVSLTVFYQVMGADRQIEIVTHIVDLRKDITISL